ncbi:hypothetical protein [Brevibacillus laterosporus]|uniref:Uncharacterized protein n=1 Tax=Brevibacillus laterosporus TaxID=1465 RepID=A0AAP3DCY6_BRELA|nr:hypothetical protein [Brevibacillus laterosporus]MCR8978650.1 hypothetical protein [Brevibacillus laterosporus]MCZ0805806.1 hypothetical protein [Brevibacillus laterosporus]MCZ0824428.1 hypothetical protein [Brevibacillus laterosporus]MCZ0848332.1 hypothetical protein [Brevibacillus laterosporus]
MKITKEQLPSKEQKKRGFQWFQKEEPAEKPYDGSVKVRITEQEYNAVISACHMKNEGYKSFVRTALEGIDEVDELTQPQTEEDPKDWLTLEFDKDVKERLVAAADKARLPLETIVRGLIWTKVKQTFKAQKEQDERRMEQRRKESYRAVMIRLEPELIQQYESKFGRINSITDIEYTLKNLLQKELA